MIKVIERYVQALVWRTSQIAQVALFLSMAIIVANVLLRIPWKPVPGTVEIVEMLGAVLLALSVAYTGIMKGHIMVGVLVDRFSLRVQAAVDVFVNIISLSFTYVLGRAIVSFAASSLARGYTTGFLYIPIAPAIYLVAFGFLLLALVLLLDLAKAAVILFRRSESG